jgi:hypothetical protein
MGFAFLFQVFGRAWRTVEADPEGSSSVHWICEHARVGRGGSCELEGPHESPVGRKTPACHFWRPSAQELCDVRRRCLFRTCRGDMVRGIVLWERFGESCA